MKLALRLLAVLVLAVGIFCILLCLKVVISGDFGGSVENGNDKDSGGKSRLESYQDVQCLLKKSESFYTLVRNSVSGFPFYPVSRKILHGKSEEEASRLKNEIGGFSRGTRPVLGGKQIHELLSRFIEAQKGSSCSEIREIYKEMTISSLVLRLLVNRPLAFYNPCDTTLFRNFQYKGMTDIFISLESSKDDEHINLKNYLTYEEIQVGALISMSVPTHFYNAATREEWIGDESMHPKTRPPFAESGVLIGAVGARFERPGLMESQFIEVSRSHSIPENGFGPMSGKSFRANILHQVWLPFYRKNDESHSDHFPTFNQIKSLYEAGNEQIIKDYWKVERSEKISYIHRPSFQIRLHASLLPTIADAIHRFKESGKPAHVRITGLGAGVWNPDVSTLDLPNLFVAATNEVVSGLGDGHGISVIEFNSLVGTNITDDQLIGWKSLARNAESKGIRVIRTHFSKGELSNSPVSESHILVAQYAWDGNSYPGNEYWLGSITGSMDPVHAHVSMIGELQNPQINEAAFTEQRVRLYEEDGSIVDLI